jgi:hypothetical protein
MNGEKLQQMAAECAEGLPGTALEHPFGPEWDVHKVRGKVFMLITDVTGQPMVILKAAPDEAATLREQHAGITRSYAVALLPDAGHARCTPPRDRPTIAAPGYAEPGRTTRTPAPDSPGPTSR